MHLRAAQAVFGNADGRCLHRACFDPAVSPLAQMVLQHHRVGRGQSGGLHRGLAVHEAAYAQRAHQATACRIKLRQGLRQPPARAGFAIRACYGNHIHGLRRPPVKGSGNFAGILPQPLVHSQSASLLSRQCIHSHEVECLYALRLNQTGSCPLLQSLKHIAPGIVRSPRPRDKGFVRLQLAAIGLQTSCLHALQPSGRFVWRLQAGHGGQQRAHSDSCTASTTTPGCTDISGATPSKRKACCTTSLKTGAATAPP